MEPIPTASGEFQGATDELGILTIRSWLLPGLIEATRESFGLHFVSIDEDPHSRINVQHSSISTEGATLWLPEREWSLQNWIMHSKQKQSTLAPLKGDTLSTHSYLCNSPWSRQPRS